MREIMSLGQTAEYLRVSKITMYRNMKNGKIPSMKIGGAYRFKRSVIDSWIKQKTTSQCTDRPMSASAKSVGIN